MFLSQEMNTIDPKITQILINAKVNLVSDVRIQEHYYTTISYIDQIKSTHDDTKKVLPSLEDTRMVDEVTVNQRKAGAEGECSVIG